MEIARLNWAEFVRSKKDHVTVEHIYPQTAKSMDWPTFSILPKKEREALLNSVGNLLPLSHSRNARFSNRPFAAKKQDAEGVQGYYNGSYSEIEVAQNQDWTPDTIKARGLEMLAFLEERWVLRFRPRGKSYASCTLTSRLHDAGRLGDHRGRR